MPPAGLDMCSKHVGQPLRLWCETHGERICLHCIVVDHKSCDSDFFEQMLARHQPAMAAALAELEAQQHPIEQASLSCSRSRRSSHFDVMRWQWRSGSAATDFSRS